MSWDQDYSVPSVEQLFEKLTGKTARQLLHEELERQGIFVKRFEDVLLEDGYFQDVMGVKVSLTDGRVYIPKLTESFTENGNHGINVYEYCLENETPIVKYTNEDDINRTQSEIGFDTEGYGETDEAPLASDGELEGEEDLRDQSY